MKRSTHSTDGSVTLKLSEAEKASLWITIREGRRALNSEYAAYDSELDLMVMHELARKGFGKAQNIVTTHTERVKGQTK